MIKYVFRIFTLLFICDAVAATAYNNIYDNTDITDNRIITDSIIDADANISLSNIDIKRSVTITNYGNVSSNITVANGMDLKINNFGTISGQITLNSNSHLYQYIHDESYITGPLNVTSGYEIIVENANKLSLAAIASVIGNPNVILRLKDSTLVLDYDLTSLSNVVGSGEIFLIADEEHMPDANNAKNYISGNGRVFIIPANNNDPLNSTQTSTGGNSNLYVRQVRETDYAKVLKNSVGEYLNVIREYNPDDKLLRALDAATSLNELNSIMARSARIHPELMMRPIRTYDNMLVDDMASRADMPDGALRDMFVFSDDFDMYAVNANVGGRVTDAMFLSGFISVGQMNWSDDVNEFDAAMFSLGVRANYQISYTDIIHGIFGATYADFDSADVFDGTAAVGAPHGNEIFGAVDFEHRFYFANRFFIAPIVGARSARSEIMGDSDFDSALRGGINAGYGFTGLGLAYGYGMRAYAETSGNISAEAKISIWSPLDAAGGDLSFAIISADEYTAYKISLGGHFMF